MTIESGILFDFEASRRPCRAHVKNPRFMGQNWGFKGERNFYSSELIKKYSNHNTSTWTVNMVLVFLPVKNISL